MQIDRYPPGPIGEWIEAWLQWIWSKRPMPPKPKKDTPKRQPVPRWRPKQQTSKKP